jgi:hypothetical protein
MLQEPANIQSTEYCINILTFSTNMAKMKITFCLFASLFQIYSIMAPHSSQELITDAFSSYAVL